MLLVREKPQLYYQHSHEPHAIELIEFYRSTLYM
jgi:hypothetical protein